MGIIDEDEDEDEQEIIDMVVNLAKVMGIIYENEDEQMVILLVVNLAKKMAAVNAIKEDIT